MLTLTNGSRILEHRFVMSKLIGRKLKETEAVHHGDRNGKNNDPKNLELLSRSAHSLLHGKDRKISYVKICCPQCKNVYKRQKRLVKYRTKKGQRVFCSKKCSGKFSNDLYWKN